jgi:hypothetical protein
MLILEIKAEIAESVPRRATDQTAGIRFPEGKRLFSVLQSVETGSGAHPIPYAIGTKGSFLGCKAAGT